MNVILNTLTHSFWGPTSWLELFWLIVVGVGLYFHVRGILRAREDKRVLDAAALNGRRLIIVREHLLNEKVRLGIQLWFAYLGISGALAHPRVDQVQLRLADSIFIITFFAIAIALDYLSIRQLLNRKKLLSMPSGS